MKNIGTSSQHGLELFPEYGSPEVKKAEEFIMSFVQGDDRINTFFREYLGHSLPRIAMNYLYLKSIIKNGDSCLDVGSIGIEFVLLKNDYPDSSFYALSYEGGRVGITDGKFYETLDPDDPNCVTINQVDVEREPLAYADKTFDVVSCFEIIEHLKINPVPMLNEMQRVLKPDGRLILTTPNINSSWAISKIIGGKSPSEEPRYNKNPQYGIIHSKEYTVDELTILMRDLGFVVESVFTYDDQDLTSEEIFVRKKIAGFKARMEGGFFVFSKNAGLELGHRIAVVAQKGDKSLKEFPEIIFQ